MYRIIHSFLFLLSLSQISFHPSSSASARRSLLQSTAVCPLNFDALRRFAPGTRSECQYIRQGLRLVLSEHLRQTGSFLPPTQSAKACRSAFESFFSEFVPNFDIRRRCGFRTEWIAVGCMNLTTRSGFESVVPRSALGKVSDSCDQPLLNGSPCASCTTALSNIQASYLPDRSLDNVCDCTAYPFIYAAAFINRFGPSDEGTTRCFFNLYVTPPNSSINRKKIVIIVVIVVVSGLISILGFSVLLFLGRRKSQQKPNKNDASNTNVSSGLDSFSGSTTLIRFAFDEIKAATRNFSMDNIIGKGCYGNVYKGLLPDGSEVALKRFKNCSASGDPIFTHEVEVIASVRHVNLVALRGYCTATIPLVGHQRIIVCDLMKNGSVHDHLFGLTDNKLSWPVRQRIALGTAKGLAYLHYGARPGIIHRDIKASNILLDEKFEPKVADFGLAKFTPEGMTHLSTRVAGTMGYVVPEYALYRQLTERSDVYSFGVVLLELLSGKKALMNDGQPSLVSDWAWSLVRKGRAMDVVEDSMLDLGSPEVVEKYVLVGVLCSHPQLYARPTMDQVVKMLDMDVPISCIPERPISLMANVDEIERSASSSGSGNLSTPGGYQAYSFVPEHVETGKGDFLSL